MNAQQMPRAQPVAIPRPQVGIERLPARRATNEPRESMNCKSCRKRKIKCNRLRPACEACQVFQCACIYDAVPKKRGPKTDVLEALLKRVDGLEAKLKDKNSEEGSASPPQMNGQSTTETQVDESPIDEPRPKRQATSASKSPTRTEITKFTSPIPLARESPSSQQVPSEALIDTYFARLHGRPHHILDESSVRLRIQSRQLPSYLIHAMLAVAARYTPHPLGFVAAVQLSDDYASRARQEIDVDEPSIEALQALLLLVLAFSAAGKGNKRYMLMTTAIGMAMALELHRELDTNTPVTPAEREIRRRLFWTCYMLDRYLVCGSKKSSLINDETIILRLPSWSLDPSSMPIEGEFFQCGSNLQYFQGAGKKSQGSLGMLIDITRILGVTNKYLAAGGVKGDSHFPWHSLSNLSKIRHDLDTWASGTSSIFSNIDLLFGQYDSTVLVLSKLIYHLIHCLIYRPFLPVDLSELAGNGQHQSWQIEATNICFLHANAIAELIRLGKQAGTVEWPAFVGYCICTAGTVHIHGAYYGQQGSSGEQSVFGSSADLLSQEMQFLNDLRFAWAGMQQQRDILDSIYRAHGELVKTLTSAGTRYNPSLHLEDFFDRYASVTSSPGGRPLYFHATNMSFCDVVLDLGDNRHNVDEASRAGLKRKNTAESNWNRPDAKTLASLQPQTANLANPARPSLPVSQLAGMAQPNMLTTPPAQHTDGQGLYNTGAMRGGMDEAAATAAAAGFGPINAHVTGQGMQGIAGVPFTPPYSYTSAPNSTPNTQPPANDGVSYDPMFGGLPTNTFTSPAAWANEDQGNLSKLNRASNAVAAPSPSNKSNNGSTGTGQGDEKDPFLSLLEQLAENEGRFNNGTGNELDYFLSSTSTGV